MKTRRAILAAAAITALMMTTPGIAPAHTAYRYMSDGTHGDSITNDSADSAFTWIKEDPHAKGSYNDHYGNKTWVVFRDTRIYHKNTASTRPGPYWNAADPKYYTRAIQYTLKNMGYSLVDDNVYGPGTKTQVYNYQHWNGLAADGVTGPQSYHFLSYAKGL